MTIPIDAAIEAEGRHYSNQRENARAKFRVPSPKRNSTR